MNIEELTIGEARKLASIFNDKSISDNPYKIGGDYLIRTVTMIDTGKIVGITEHEIVLESAAWIADTGRFSEALAGEIKFSEIEPFPEGQVIVGRASVIDAVQIKFPLPRSKK